MGKREQNRLRTGVIGAGHMGRYHAEKFAARADCRVVAIADLERSRAEAVRADARARFRGDPSLALLELEP